MRKAVIALAALAIYPVFAQRPAASLQFEVASVKRVDPRGGPGDTPRNMDPSPGHFAMRNVPLRFALEWAYGLEDYQLFGPDWIKAEERYDMVATAAGPASDAQMKRMLQALLTERFQMKVHRETKELSVYALVAGKGAPKVKRISSDDAPSLSGGQTALLFHNQPLSRLTFLLTRRMGTPVLDLTGLDGSYDYTVDISGLNGFNPQSIADSGPSIFTAVQTDLGLKLESRKAPVDILVIDSVNRVPTEN